MRGERGSLLAWEEVGLASHRESQKDIFITVSLASMGPAGWALQGDWAARLRAQYGGLSHSGVGLPQAWVGSLGETHRIYLVLESLDRTTRG